MVIPMSSTRIGIVIKGRKVSFFQAFRVGDGMELSILRTQVEKFFIDGSLGVLPQTRVYEEISSAVGRSDYLLEEGDASKCASLFELRDLKSEIDAREKIAKVLGEQQFSLLFV